MTIMIHEGRTTTGTTEEDEKLEMQLSLRTHFLVLKVPDPATIDSQSARR